MFRLLIGFCLLCGLLAQQNNQQYQQQMSASKSYIVDTPNIHRVVTNQLTTFYVQLRDINDMNMSTTNVNLKQVAAVMKSVSGGGGNINAQAVAANMAGLVSFSYTPVMGGLYMMTVTVTVNNQKEQVTGSPLTIVVVELDSMNPIQSYLRGRGVESPVGLGSNTFNIVPVDYSGVPGAWPGMEFSASLSGPTEVRVVISDSQDGTYAASYNVEHTGEYVLKVNYLDPVTGATMPVGEPVILGVVQSVSSAAETGGNGSTQPQQPDNPSVPWGPYSTASGQGLVTATAGTQASFTVQTYNYAGHKMTVGGAAIYTDLPGAIMTDNQDGTYTFSYTTTQAGITQFSVKVNQLEIQGSPFQLSVSSGPSYGSAATASGTGLSRGLLNGQLAFVVQARDHYGNSVRVGGDTVTANIMGQAVNFVDNRDGTYTGVYTATQKGSHQLTVRVNDQEINGSPFTVNVYETIPGVPINIPIPSDTVLAELALGLVGLTLLCVFCCVCRKRAALKKKQELQAHIESVLEKVVLRSERDKLRTSKDQYGSYKSSDDQSDYYSENY